MNPSNIGESQMTTMNTGGDAANFDRDDAVPEDHQSSINMLGVASIALSGLGFLTLLRLADRRDRTPAKALGLFFATSMETVSGTVLGLRAASHARESEHRGKELLLGTSGAVLGFITILLNFNWMRTRRRL
jgi:hypothetical protein